MPQVWVIETADGRPIVAEPDRDALPTVPPGGRVVAYTCDRGDALAADQLALVEGVLAGSLPPVDRDHPRWSPAMDRAVAAARYRWWLGTIRLAFLEWFDVAPKKLRDIFDQMPCPRCGLTKWSHAPQCAQRNAEAIVSTFGAEVRIKGVPE